MDLRWPRVFRHSKVGLVKIAASSPGFELNIFKMGSWNHMGHTENMIIKDFIMQMCVRLENSLYFSGGDSFSSNPDLPEVNDRTWQGLCIEL